MSSSSNEWSNDSRRVIDRLPSKYECYEVLHLILQQKDCGVTEDELVEVLPWCPQLEVIILTGVPELTDRAVVVAASSAVNLHGIDLSDCEQVSDVGILDLVAKSPPLRWILLNGLTGLTDPSVSAITKSCPHLVELELCNLPLVTAVSIRDIWTYSRKLRTLKLARNAVLSDKAFPSHPHPSPANRAILGPDKPLPPRPATWLEKLPPLLLTYTNDNLRVLDLTSCSKLTDNAVEGIVHHAPKIQTLILSGCLLLTDRAIEHIGNLGQHLDILMLAHVWRISDRSIMTLTRSCSNLRSIDLACKVSIWVECLSFVDSTTVCRNLTDMTVFELASLDSIRRISLVRVPKLTDIALFSLAEHAKSLERLHLSYCDSLSLDAVHLLLKKLEKLQLLTATGIPSFKRKGVKRFSDTPPKSMDAAQQAVYRVFGGANISKLRSFLDKEQVRRRQSEVKNMPFTARSDDRLDLY